MQRRLTRALFLGFALHLGALATLGFARQAEPLHHLRLTPQSDGLVLFGLNRFGLLAVRVFENWGDTTRYLEGHGLALQPVTYTQPSLAYAPSSVISGPRDLSRPLGSHRIVWENSERQKQVLLTPDAESARVISHYIRYQALSASVFGYSIELN